MHRSLAQEIDRVGLIGSGESNEPQGIYGATGIGTTARVGLLGHYEPIVNGLRGLLESNAVMERVDKNEIMSPLSWAKLENQRRAAGQPVRRPQTLEQKIY